MCLYNGTQGGQRIRPTLRIRYCVPEQSSFASVRVAKRHAYLAKPRSLTGRGFCIQRLCESRLKFAFTVRPAGRNAASIERSTATPFSRDGVRPAMTSGQNAAIEPTIDI